MNLSVCVRCFVNRFVFRRLLNTGSVACLFCGVRGGGGPDSWAARDWEILICNQMFWESLGTVRREAFCDLSVQVFEGCLVWWVRTGIGLCRWGLHNHCQQRFIYINTEKKASPLWIWCEYGGLGHFLKFNDHVSDSMTEGDRTRTGNDPRLKPVYPVSPWLPLLKYRDRITCIDWRHILLNEIKNDFVDIFHYKVTAFHERRLPNGEKNVTSAGTLSTVGIQVIN